MVINLTDEELLKEKENWLKIKSRWLNMLQKQ